MMHRRVCLIPLDSRPVCYDLPLRLAQVVGIELCLPSPKLLGSYGNNLKAPANFKALHRWVKNHLFERDPVIVALDTIAYGGLIASRLGEEPFDLLEQRIETFFKMVKTSHLYAFSSILRIPSYNNDQEEPAYWAKYGALLYQYSWQMHQTGQVSPELEAKIPAEVVIDFLKRRKRNFMLNQCHLEHLAQGKLDYLAFCQDDTGAFGLNVKEAEWLEQSLQERNLTPRAHLQTGADEVACCLFTRWLLQSTQTAFSVYPFYSSPQGQGLVARFDGLPIDTVVQKQINACGASLAKTPEEADLWLMVHTPHSLQGDHCEGIAAKTQPEQLAKVCEIFKSAELEGKPVALADVAYANGSDPQLMTKLLQQLEDLSSLYGYAGWNTPGNTLGTAISMGIVRTVAEKLGQFDPKAFATLMCIRLGEDWLYQADVRQKVRGLWNGSPVSEGTLNALMAGGMEMIAQRLGLKGQSIRCRFPCARPFEVELVFK